MGDNADTVRQKIDSELLLVKKQFVKGVRYFETQIGQGSEDIEESINKAVFDILCDFAAMATHIGLKDAGTLIVAVTLDNSCETTVIPIKNLCTYIADTKKAASQQ